MGVCAVHPLHGFAAKGLTAVRTIGSARCGSGRIGLLDLSLSGQQILESAIASETGFAGVRVHGGGRSFAACPGGAAVGRQPEWVRAHETFLASDVMAGRGSATRDEEIAATYVGSRFLAYGLKPAPGMTGYLQAAEISAPTLDGHARLTLGALTLEEGKDFTLLTSSGKPVGGPLEHADAAPAAWRARVVLDGSHLPARPRNR